MEKITKKSFIETISENATYFCGSVFRKTDEIIKTAMNTCNSFDGFQKRNVKIKQSNAVQFSNGSWLYFDQEGKKEYFKYVNKFGMTHLIQKTTYHDRFDDVDYSDYIIYGL